MPSRFQIFILLKLCEVLGNLRNFIDTHFSKIFYSKNLINFTTVKLWTKKANKNKNPWWRYITLKLPECKVFFVIFERPEKCPENKQNQTKLKLFVLIILQFLELRWILGDLRCSEACLVILKTFIGCFLNRNVAFKFRASSSSPAFSLITCLLNIRLTSVRATTLGWIKSCFLDASIDFS